MIRLVCGAEMGVGRLLCSLAGCVSGLVVCVFGLVGCVWIEAGKGGDQGYSTITSPEHEFYKEPRPEISDYIPHSHLHPAAITPPYLLLPMFHHQPSPAVSKEMFTPAAGRSSLPRVLENILVPRERQHRIRVTPVNNNHGVEVRCGYSKISVRINLALLNFRSSAAHFRLGTCPASRAEGSVLYFQYDLKECGSSLSVIKGQLFYTNQVLYRPESQGAVIRATPLTLPIQCVFNRFHYSYKIGYLPVLRQQSFWKTLVRNHVFSLSVRNDKWEEAGVSKSYVLGEPVYFEVGVDFSSSDERVYVEACHVASSEDSNSTQRYDVITNFGCLVDSKRTGSQSHYVSRQKNVLRFSLDTFMFTETTSEQLYLNCTVLVGNAAASTTAKSCTYSQSEHKWVELEGDASICNCCDSECLPPEFTSCGDQAVVSSEPWSLIPSNIDPETSDQWLNTVSGSVQLHVHDPEEEESQEEEGLYEWAELNEEEELWGEEGEEAGEEDSEEEVPMCNTETDEMMADEGMEEGDAANIVKGGDDEKEEEGAADEVQKEGEVMQKNATDFVKFSEGTWEDVEPLKNMSVSVTAVEME